MRAVSYLYQSCPAGKVWVGQKAGVNKDGACSHWYEFGLCEGQCCAANVDWKPQGDGYAEVQAIVNDVTAVQKNWGSICNFIAKVLAYAAIIPNVGPIVQMVASLFQKVLESGVVGDPQWLINDFLDVAYNFACPSSSDPSKIGGCPSSTPYCVPPFGPDTFNVITARDCTDPKAGGCFSAPAATCSATNPSSLGTSVSKYSSS